MSNKPDEITFTTDDGEEVIFEVIEQTRLGGIDYLLVSTSEDEEEEALILKDISKETDTEAIYDIVKKSMPDLLNADLTASWEKGLAMVANNEIEGNVFMKKLEDYIKTKVNKLKERTQYYY